ncbi:MAG: alpha-amylase family glycosyl hydrolase [Actinomycetota bacterium]|nr:alpha-amylase family glycosyl hydrolase [Actinomycetota bacterium]
MDSHPWWQTTVIYQIYPRSFQDTTGSGVGDLPGITRRMSYLADTLGVGAIWISPFYPSPMADFGYDVADYTDVHPMFGTLDDFDELLTVAHSHNIKVIIDWVPNHSSDQHPWFLESRSSRDNPKRDWYIWRDAKPDGSLPNNWQSAFGGPAWEFDEATGQHYLHSFVAAQPDLNWRNPELKQAMFDTVRFWLDRGIDGLRIDVAHFIGKDPELRDNPLVTDDWERKFKSHGSDYDGQVHLHDKGHPDAHNIFRELRTLLDSYEPDRFAIGEIHIADWQEWASYYGKSGDELHMPYNFSLIHTPWEAESIRSKVAELERSLPEGAWPSYVLGNHDETRLAARLGPEAAGVAAMLLLTLRGTPTLYYGDELGILQTDIAPEDQQDPWGRNLPGAGRDGCRTPMQWDRSPHGGFSPPATATTWLPTTLDRERRNVESQLQDPASLLALYRALLQYRNSSATLQTGAYRPADSPGGCYSYERTSDTSRIQIALNFADDELQVPLVDSGTVALSTYLDRKGDSAISTMTLRPNEGVIIELGYNVTPAPAE